MADINGQIGMGSLHINPYEYPRVKCTSCGNETFVPMVMFREIPGLLLGSDEKSISLPMKVYACSKCRTLSPDDQNIIEEGEQTAKTSKNGLII